ncbi:MAG: diguanylate cyclase [Terriglobales bacterium]
MTNDRQGCPSQTEPEFYKRLLDSLNDAVYFVDRERRIVYWNEGATRITGFAPDDVLGRLCYDNILAHVDDTGQPLCTGRCPLSSTMADGQARDVQVFLRHKAGHRVPIQVRVSPILSVKGEIVGAVEIFNDDSARQSIKRRAEELERLAFLDPLTQAANRRYLEICLQTALREYQLHGDPFGLLLIDLDYFKRINDQYGHDAGDCALVGVARTLNGALRSTDTLGRWGGDEFLAVVGHVNRDSLTQLAGRCCSLVGETRIPHGKGAIPISISVGGALFGGDDGVEALIARADRMLYVSKTRGRARASVECS